MGLLIGVIGGSSATSEEAKLAEAVGRKLAEARATLICGGRGGIMEAACKGASEFGGMTIGILSGTERSEANPYVGIPIVTGMGDARNVIIARSAQAVIAIGGSYGTLSEIAYSLGFGTPVVGLRTWTMERDGHPDVPILYVSEPDEATEQALALARRSYQRIGG